MNISLPPEMEAWVRDKVATGFYGSASEVVREALRLLRDHEQDQADKLEALRVEIQKGLDSGPAVDGEKAFECLRETLEHAKETATKRAG